MTAEYILLEQEVELKDGGLGCVSLATANIDDIDALRHWKNNARASFFCQAIITIESQIQWFAEYQARANDFIFIVRLDNSFVIGCVGCRVCDSGNWDVYNIINGAPEYLGMGIMRHALGLLVKFCRSRRNTSITLKVLRSNSAVAWYQRNGFLVQETCSDHFVMAYNL